MKRLIDYFPRAKVSAWKDLDREVGVVDASVGSASPKVVCKKYDIGVNTSFK